MPLFVCLLSFSEGLRARQQKKPLPRYMTRARLKGGTYTYSFQASPGGPHIRPRGEPGTPEFRAAYSAALLEAIAMEDDSNE